MEVETHLYVSSVYHGQDSLHTYEGIIARLFGIMIFDDDDPRSLFRRKVRCNQKVLAKMKIASFSRVSIISKSEAAS